MKKIIAFILLLASSVAVRAQLTGIGQDFNAVCSTGSGFPLDWTSYNPLAATMPQGEWACAPGQGRDGSNGMKCTGVWSSTYHLDTAFLITYAMNLTGYPDHIYFYFDSKVSNIHLGARLSLMETPDSTILDTLSGATNLSSALSPVFGNEDSTDWVTHVVDLTPFKGTSPVYIAFRYTSTTTTGSTWFIDNVHTSPFPAHVAGPVKEQLVLQAIGNSTSSSITLSCGVATAGTYHLCISDLMGRQVYSEELMLRDTQTVHAVDGLNLAPGMYIIRMSGGGASVTAKTVVR